MKTDKQAPGKPTTAKIKTRLKWLGPIALGIGSLGGALIGLALVTVWDTGWGIDLFAPGTVLITVALSSYVAGRGVISWREQRERDRESAEYRHREHVYEQLGVYIVNRFQGIGADSMKEAELKIGATLWGSKALVEQLVRYQDMISQLLGDRDGGKVALSEDQQKEIKGIIGDILQAMRRDLQPFTGQEQVGSDVLINSLFNRKPDEIVAAARSQS